MKKPRMCFSDDTLTGLKCLTDPAAVRLGRLKMLSRPASGKAGGSGAGRRGRVSALAFMLVAAIGGGMFATGCAKQKTFVMVPKGEHPFYEPCAKGFREAGEEAGVRTEFIAAKTYDLAKQVEIIEGLIARRVDGIAISALSDQGLVPVIEKATQAGIKVVTFDAPAPSSAALAYIGTGNEAAGYTAAENLIPLMNGRGEVAVFQGGLDAPNLNDRYKGFARCLAEKAPEIKIVAREDTGADFDTTTQKVREALRAHPRLKAIFGFSAEVCPGAISALKEEGKAGTIILAGFDDLPGTRDGLREGIVSFAIVQRAYNMGWLSVHSLLDAINGKPLPQQIDTGVFLVNRHTVNSLGPVPVVGAAAKAGSS